ncbi:lysostaphin resistance A-like protein [Haloferax prahovense]|uniref:CPBP family intramembrane glutamic endopeptidase n=1 Tax=Haloferax prahovense TaxID=381852 RepID=UPI003C727ED7
MATSTDATTAPPAAEQLVASPSRLTFRSSLTPLLVFALGIAVSYPVVVFLAQALVPPSPYAGNLFTAAAITGSALVAWGVLRWEDVSLAAIGLDRTRVVTGTLAVVTVWLIVNVLGYVLLVLLGEAVTLGLPADPQMGLPVDAPVMQVAAVAITLWLFVGIGEELAFRGYLQNKLIAHLGTTRSRTALGIACAAVLFSLLHLPVYVWVAELALPQLAVTLAFTTVYALLLGVIYELTRNIVLVGLFHGTFDLNPLFVVGETGAPVGDLTLLVLPVALVVFWGYRRWAKTQRPGDFQPQTTVDAVE